MFFFITTASANRNDIRITFRRWRWRRCHRRRQDYLFVCVAVLRPSQPNVVMSSAVSLPNHTFTGQAWSSKRLANIVHILSPETDNCPSWISRRERMTVENISWSISTKECCRPRRGFNPRPPVLQSDDASNWATEAGIDKIKSVRLAPFHKHIFHAWLNNV